MNKADLIDALAKDLNLSTDIASSIVGTILGAMTETMVRGENVEIRGFGSFSVREYAAYTGRNPKTGEAYSSIRSAIDRWVKRMNIRIDGLEHCLYVQ